MKKQFNLILDFNKLKKQEVQGFFGEEIVINGLFKLDGETINLNNPNYICKVRINTKNGGCKIYSKSLVEIINADKGLIKCSLKPRLLLPNDYSMMFEIYSTDDDNTIYTGEIKLRILENLEGDVSCYVSDVNIETLKELDNYIRHASKILREVEEKLYGQ